MQADRRLARSRFVVESGGMEGAVAYLAEHEAPQLLIVETAAAGDELFGSLESLAEVCDPGVKVVVLGHENDIALYKQLIEMGLSEYYCGPISTDALIGIVETIFSEPDSQSLGRVIAFVGARGGVGSSSIAANTAHALGQVFKDDVILVDLDLPFGTSALAFNLSPRQNITEALAEPDRLDDVLMERFMLKYDNYLSVAPAPAELGDQFKIELESFEVLLELVRKMASFVVLDLPHEWPAWVHEILLDANEVAVTAYPDLTNLRDAKNIFDVLGTKRGVDAPLRLVLNRVGASKNTELTAKDFEESLGVDPVATIPFEAALFGTAMNNGEMVAEVNKGSKAAKAFLKLADVVSARIPVAKAGGGKSLLSMLKRA
jgi:pilus assembly protein CpaE